MPTSPAASATTRQFGVRFNGVYRNGSTPVDRQSQEVGAAVMGMDFRGERLRAASTTATRSRLQRAAAASPTSRRACRCRWRPAGTATGSSPGPTWIRRHFGVAKAEYDIAPDWTIYGAAGGRSTLFESLRGGVATIIDWPPT